MAVSCITASHWVSLEYWRVHLQAFGKKAENDKKGKNILAVQSNIMFLSEMPS